MARSGREGMAPEASAQRAGVLNAKPSQSSANGKKYIDRVLKRTAVETAAFVIGDSRQSAC